MLDFQRLDDYQCALQLVRVAVQISVKVPARYAELGEQLQRAALLVPLKVAAEGGSVSVPEATARSVALECVATLDVLRALHAASREQYEEALALLARFFELQELRGSVSAAGA